MALIVCKECNNQVSNTAEKCPSCGAKVPKGLSVLQWVGVVFVGLIVIGLFAGGKKEQASAASSAPTEETAAAAPLEKALEVKASQMAKDYDQNEARADAIYKGKLVKVTGIVTGITKDLTDDTVVMLRGVNEFQGVHAEIEKSEEQKAINLQKGAKVTVQCRGMGEVVGSPMLDECTIL